ncbi:hypothetical protein Droror1_Dr00015623 [Drosera rotundifolia]
MVIETEIVCHQYVKMRENKNHVYTLTDNDGSILSSPSVIQSHAVEYFKQLLASGNSGPPLSTEQISTIHQVVQRTFSMEEVEYMCRPITAQEVKEVLFSLGHNKAPGPDGFNVEVFKLT